MYIMYIVCRWEAEANIKLTKNPDWMNTTVSAVMCAILFHLFSCFSHVCY